MGSPKKADGFFVRNKSVLFFGFTALTVAAMADLIAGLFLTEMENYLLLIPGMMILIYCAIGMRGNIFGAMGSRIGTSMHIGTFQLSLKKGSVLRSNIEATFALSLIMSLLMGIFGWVVTVLFFSETDPARFIFISLIGGIFAGVIVLVFNIIIAYIGYKRDWDVDNITAPLIAAIGDIATVPMILVAVLIQESIGNEPTMITCVILSIVTIIITVLILVRKNKKRIDETKRIVKQSFPVLFVCMLFEIGAGILIQNVTDDLIGWPVLLVLLPAFLNEGNALSGMLTSRLSSMIHLGTIEPKILPRKKAFENFSIMYILAILTFFIIGTAAFIVKPDYSIGYNYLISTVLVAGLLTVTVINLLSYYVAILAARFNLDPDDHSIPITSSVMDVIGTAILIITIYFML